MNLPAYTPTNKISIAIHSSVFKNLKQVKGHPCFKPNEYQGYAQKKDLLALNLLCRSLRAANYKFDIEFVEVPNVPRGELLLATSKVHLLLHLRNRPDDFSHLDYFFSLPFLEDFEDFRAFFTSQTNKEALKANSLNDLTKLQAVANWDWQKEILEKLNIQYQHAKYRDVASFINKSRADIVLLHLVGKQPLQKRFRKMRLRATGSVYLSRKINYSLPLAYNMPGIQEFNQALSSGLSLMRENGTIERLFAGFIVDPDKLKGWKRIELELPIH